MPTFSSFLLQLQLVGHDSCDTCESLINFAGFKHVNEAEAKAKAAEEARKTESEFGVGMPGAQTTGENIKNWIEAFRLDFFVDDPTASGERRLKEGHSLTKEVLLNIHERLRVWASTPTLSAQHIRIKTFLGDLNAAFTRTFGV